MPRPTPHLSVLLDDVVLRDGNGAVEATAPPLAARFGPLPPVSGLPYYKFSELHSRTAIPYRQPRRDLLCGLQCLARAPRTSVLCRLLALMTALMVLVHMVSCGLFFCVSLPFQRHNYVDLSEILAETSLLGGSPALAAARPDHGSSPKLIPRIIHQTFRSRQVPENAKAIMRSWREHNGNGWQIRFYDDEACLDFVRREFPEYLQAYKALPKDVERSDFFRYMVVLRLGGVYADIDVECRQPLDKVIRPTDTMVVGWESEVSSDAQAYKRHFARKRQVLQWFFAAAPGHPVLRQICEHVAHSALRSFSNNTNRDTLERTGPGVWTDIVLRHSLRHPVHKLDDPYKVRVLPRVSFGVHPAGIDGLTPSAHEIVVLHHFMGSWKVRGGWYKKKPLLRQVQDIMAPVLPWLRPSSSAEQPEEPIRETGVQHFPVSASFEPPFVVMVDLIGHGDPQAGTDVSAQLSNWGTWQPALAPTRRPSVVEALVGSLGAHRRRSLLVDVGAGHGFFSLAAAAREHQVHAFELSECSRRVLQASVRYNGFQARVQLHGLALGAGPARICVALGGAQPDVHMRRGYGDPADHAPANASACAAWGRRTTLAAALSDVGSGDGDGAGAAGGAGGIGALRISANGHEGWVLEGALPLLNSSRQPDVIYLEFAPRLMRKAGYQDPARVLALLHSLGYQDMAHAGYVCDERWFNITNTLRSQASFTSTGQEALQQPTWCKLRPELFSLLVARAHDEVPENVLLVHKNAAASQQPPQQEQEQQVQEQQEQAREQVQQEHVQQRPGAPGTSGNSTSSTSGNGTSSTSGNGTSDLAHGTRDNSSAQIVGGAADSNAGAAVGLPERYHSSTAKQQQQQQQQQGSISSGSSRNSSISGSSSGDEGPVNGSAAAGGVAPAGHWLEAAGVSPSRDAASASEISALRKLRALEHSTQSAAGAAAVAA